MSSEPTFMTLPRALAANFASVSEHLKHFGFTLMICISVATVLWMVSKQPFLEHLVFSLCIGLSIHIITMGALYFVQRIPIWVVWLVTVPVGVAVGLSLGARLNGIPLHDLIESDSPIMSLVVALIASYVFYSYYSMIEMRDRLREEELSRIVSEKQLVETRLRLLQSQIEPHFLFNSLSHVVGLIGTDAERAETMLHKLTHFLRASLRRSRSARATLQDELDLVADYLAIVQVRLGNRMSWTIDTELDASRIRFAPLILQPLVENAIVHGLEPLEEGGNIRVTVAQQADCLHISVADTGAGLGQSTRGLGFGLDNVRGRLNMLYGKGARLAFADVVPHGLDVSITIPMDALAI